MAVSKVEFFVGRAEGGHAVTGLRQQSVCLAGRSRFGRGALLAGEFQCPAVQEIPENIKAAVVAEPGREIRISGGKSRRRSPRFLRHRNRPPLPRTKTPHTP